MPAPPVTGKHSSPPRAALVMPNVAAPAVPGAIPHAATPSKPIAAPSRRLPAPVTPVESSSRITVQPGDSLWKLARVHLGTGYRWHDFLAVNPGLPSPGLIQPGATLVVPRSVPQAPAQAASATLSVQPGDSLWKIAAGHLGSGARWLCLAQANPWLHD